MDSVLLLLPGLLAAAVGEEFGLEVAREESFVFGVAGTREPEALGTLPLPVELILALLLLNFVLAARLRLDRLCLD